MVVNEIIIRQQNNEQIVEKYKKVKNCQHDC